MDNLNANFTKDDYLTMELGFRVIWCLYTENTGLPQVRILTIRSRAKIRDN